LTKSVIIEGVDLNNQLWVMAYLYTALYRSDAYQFWLR